MTPSAASADRHSVRPGSSRPLTVTLDGETFAGAVGQTIAGVLLSAGRTAWRTTAAGRQPRGVFCGIGVCFDCIAEVNGVRDVRLCQREAADGDEVVTQCEALPRPAGEGR